MTTPTLNINGKTVTLPVARQLLNIPEHACFGCYLGDDGPEMHDECYMGRAYRELLAYEQAVADAAALRLIDAGTALSAEQENALEERGLIIQTDKPYATITAEGHRLMEDYR